MDTMKRFMKDDVKAKKVCDRFWGHVEETNGCWEWLGTKSHQGYGKFFAFGKSWRAHRIMWMLEMQSDPGELYVCHRCDNPPCVNPDHLFLGTPKDNTWDSILKGRRRTVLDVDDVIEIRRLDRETNMKRSDIAALFGVSWTCVHYVINRVSWTHIPEEA